MKFVLQNKFAAKSCKRFPPHLNNVSTLTCETWNVHHADATAALSQKETLEFIPPQLWHPNSPDLKPVDNSVWEILQERYTKHASLICSYRRHHWRIAAAMTIQLGPLHSQSLFQFIQISDACFVHLLLLLQYCQHAVINWIHIWRIWRPQVRWDKFWSFFLWQCSGSICVMNISSFTR